MYVSNGANGGVEADLCKQKNGCVVIPVETPGWSCTTLCDADGSFFPPSAPQNESNGKHKHVLGDFCSDIFNGCENTRIGLWIPRYLTPDMATLDVQADRVPSNVIQILDSVPTKSTAEKKKVVVARKTKRSKGSNKDLMEAYRISRPSGSKDRHSKVATAKGPRDRRMRLSVETAIKFFHVQDRLGFDQPSKAVEWLIEKCSSAIDELPQLSQSLPTAMSADTHNHIAELIMNCERDQAASVQRKRNTRSSKLTTCEVKSKAKERDQEGSKRRRRGQAKLSTDVNQRPNFEDSTASCGRRLIESRQGLLQMHSHDLTGIRTFDSTHINPFFNCAQYSPEIAFQSYPTSSVQSAESFSGRDSTTFSVPSCPFPRVMPSITIDPQSTISEF